MEYFIFCSFHSFKILLLLVAVSPVGTFLPWYVNWIYAFFMTNLLINTLPQISHTTHYLARKKIHLYNTYLFSARKNKISLPSCCKSSLWPWVSWHWFASWVHQFLHKVLAGYSWINLLKVTECWTERLNLTTKKLKDVRWVWFGMYGEQGGESTHNEFNQVKLC